jgi:alpha-beta hydrolase superfamily lysophospholipase
MAKQFLLTADGAKLHRLHFPVARPHMHVLILHGYMEHSGRYHDLARFLNTCNFSVTVFDWRGHGASHGQRGYIRDSNSYFNDLDAVMSEPGVRNETPLAILGHSMGGLLALSYVSRRRLELAALIAINPYIAAYEEPPLWKHWFGLGAGKLLPRLSLPHRFLPELLTSDLAVQRKHSQDPAVFHVVNASWYVHIRLLQQELIGEVPAGLVLNAPVLFLVSPGDRISHPDASLRLAKAVRGPKIDIWHRIGEAHEVLQERHRLQTFDALAKWLLEQVSKKSAAYTSP